MTTRAARAESIEEACRLALAALGDSERDLPFARVYLLDGASTRCVASIGAPVGDGGWPFGDVLESRAPVHVDEPHPALLLPMIAAHGLCPSAVLVAGIAPGVDDEHRRFLDLAASMLASAIAKLTPKNGAEEHYRRVFETAEVSILDEDYSALKPFLAELVREHGARLGDFLVANPDVVDDAIGRVRIREVNPATLRMFGAADVQQFRDSFHSIFVHETCLVFVELLVALAEGRAMSSSEVALRTLDGRRIDVVFTVNLPPRDGPWDRLLLTLQDISSRRLAETEREARLAEVERALGFSETFVGVLGHDLRAPINAITTAADLLLSRESSPRTLQPLERIHKSADRMTRMIDQVLDFTRARIGGGIPVHLATEDLRVISTQIIGELCGDTRRRIFTKIHGDTLGEWDADRLAQVIANLLSNGLQHGEAEGLVHMTIDGTESAEVRVEVTNSGAIPEALQPRLFDPFRLAATRKKGASGLGLGLYIVHQVVLAHRGTIDVRSHTAETTFTVRLPRRSNT
jgi:signal transduction histidine kinase